MSLIVNVRLNNIHDCTLDKLSHVIGGTYFVENVNLPIFMVGNGKIVSILEDLRYKKAVGNKRGSINGRFRYNFHH